MNTIKNIRRRRVCLLLIVISAATALSASRAPAMAKVQLDADLSDAEVNDIVAFLTSLTGSLPEGFERAPVLPASGFRSSSSTPSSSPKK